MGEITREQIEKLRLRTGATYEEAVAAIEAAGGDLLDALIFLEQRGRAGAGETGGFYSTRRGGSERQPPPPREVPPPAGYGELPVRAAMRCMIQNFAADCDAAWRRWTGR